MPMETDNMMDDISPFDSVSNWGDEMEQSFESSKESDNKVLDCSKNFERTIEITNKRNILDFFEHHF